MTLHQLIDPNWTNIGDLVVLEGAKKVLPLDANAVVGTPWFWDACAGSDKYQWLRHLLDASPPLMAVGVGSCFPLGRDERMILDSPDQSEAIRSLWSRFTRVSVRDEMAKRLLDALGVHCILLPCPSVFAVDPEPLPPPTPGSTIYITTRPWGTDTCHSQFLDHKAPDVTMFNYGYGKRSTNDVWRFLDHLASYETIISERVHAVTPFAGLRRTAVIPVDSRHLTSTNAGVALYPSIAKPDASLRPHWRERYQQFFA